MNAPLPPPCQDVIQPLANDLTNAEQHDVLTMRLSLDWFVPKQEEGIDAAWVDAFLTLRIADVLAKRFYGKPLMQLAAKDRAVLRDYADSCVEDAGRIFGLPAGDPEYRPQDEDDDLNARDQWHNERGAT